jgi:hypothetical protein
MTAKTGRSLKEGAKVRIKEAYDVVLGGEIGEVKWINDSGANVLVENPLDRVKYSLFYPWKELERVK